MANRASFKSRLHLTTPDDELASDFGRVLELFERAFPPTSDYAEFARHMNHASREGRTWIEALEYTAFAREDMGKNKRGRLDGRRI